MGIESPTRGIFQTIQKAKSHMRAWKSTTTNLKTLKTETQDGEAFREEKQRARSRSPCFANFCYRYGTCWNLSRGGRRQWCAVVQRIEMIWPCQLARELPSYMYCTVACVIHAKMDVNVHGFSGSIWKLLELLKLPVQNALGLQERYLQKHRCWFRTPVNTSSREWRGWPNCKLKVCMHDRHCG